MQLMNRSLKAVKEVFPDYGDGFIDACLSHYNNSSEQVINAILEGEQNTKEISLIHSNTTVHPT